MTEKLLREIRDSQINTEAHLKYLAERLQGHHLTLYGSEGTSGVVGRVNDVKSTLRVVTWTATLITPVLTALVLALVQAYK